MLPVQFHESYGYEDFVHGIRPNYNAETDNTRFVPEDGVFLKFCRSARNNPARHVLVIDEINRCQDLPSLRRALVALGVPGQDDHTPVWSAVFDTAKRLHHRHDEYYRPFHRACRLRATPPVAFMTLWPVRDGKSVVLNAWLKSRGIANAEEVDRLFVALNTAIAAREEALMVGHSYLMVKEAEEAGRFSDELLEFIWRSQILPTGI